MAEVLAWAHSSNLSNVEVLVCNPSLQVVVSTKHGDQLQIKITRSDPFGGRLAIELNEDATGDWHGQRRVSHAAALMSFVPRKIAWIDRVHRLR